eukprot:scaffold163330_cov15-Tisochrysis_lutea.AAC.1
MWQHVKYSKDATFALQVQCVHLEVVEDRQNEFLAIYTEPEPLKSATPDFVTCKTDVLGKVGVTAHFQENMKHMLWHYTAGLSFWFLTLRKMNASLVVDQGDVNLYHYVPRRILRHFMVLQRHSFNATSTPVNGSSPLTTSTQDVQVFDVREITRPGLAMHCCHKCAG